MLSDVNHPVMGVRIGIRELRDKLASYMESTVPIEVTRHGQTVGSISRSQGVPARPSGRLYSRRGAVCGPSLHASG